MRKTDLVAIIGVVAAGAFFLQGKPTSGPAPATASPNAPPINRPTEPVATPPSPEPTAAAVLRPGPGRFDPGSFQLAGLKLEATQAEALARLEEPSQKVAGHDPGYGNWIYQCGGGSLNLYWEGGRLRGIQCSVVDENHPTAQKWELGPGLKLGATPEQVSAFLGSPTRTRPGPLESWTYASPPGLDPRAELEVAFVRGKMRNVNVNVR